MSKNNSFSHYEHLAGKWIHKNREIEKKLWQKHKGAFEWLQLNTRHFIVGTIGGLLMASAALSHPNIARADIVNSEFIKVDKKHFLMSDLKVALPDTVTPLTYSQADVIAQILTRHFGFSVKSELQGKRLNTNYGLIGLEQHLARYPGDNLEEHFENKEDSDLYSATGMAPGLGAWGYFALSKSQFTEIDKLREKYYVAVQTFLTPGYNEHVKKYNEFFKYRKLLVVNPSNGKAIVADIADAGPSPWTGKQLGGSPEVMHYLERVDGAQKGAVLYFFINDPRDEIKLGPVIVKETQ